MFIKSKKIQSVPQEFIAVLNLYSPITQEQLRPLKENWNEANLKINENEKNKSFKPKHLLVLCQVFKTSVKPVAD